MPVIENSSYRTRGIFKNAHVNTVYAAMFRPEPEVKYRRERLELSDGDFLDLDWSGKGSENLLIALHGLEGSAERPYIKGMARYFNRQGWDCLGLNFRGCSGESNRLLRSYHIGETGDLKMVIQHALQQYHYRRIALTGFSLGGNVVLKYLGEDDSQLPAEVIGGITFSVPCDVLNSNTEIDKWHNRHYLWKFLITLNQKIQEKANRFPDQLELPERMPRNFREFDEWFTAPIHGFDSAEHYWSSSSSLKYLPSLGRPALLVNALDDTFLSPQSYPYEVAKEVPHFYLETPTYGGHVGFVLRNSGNEYWAEQRAFEFVRQILNGQIMLG